ncbi:MAG: Galactose/methyl galactoside import ATP-binding protein MglA [Herbaspirillum frisingense]|uniref:Galactose/methyl galactoside import ATP-binding protein MglA n=1 Tax=Herbaspirillum frisingense TaxID=92645 RepID=A0A7V8FV95_9BURK|nr:MAG: Galactose/methyl galactoside import ATP-binding protein MglA [Herbaspirillum frisingense]
MNQHPIDPVQGAPLIELRGVSKLYANGTLANDGIDLAIHAGELHAIVGENGAGKSTVMKMLYGLEQPSSGGIFMQDQPLPLDSPTAAIAAGIGLVPQHVQLLPSFTVAENIVLGCEPMKGWRIDRAGADSRVRALMQTFGLAVDPAARVRTLPIGVQQRVGILKALYRGARILLLDEPTAVLAAQEARALFGALRAMVARGLTVVLITHKLDEVREFADRFTVLRCGRVSGAGLSSAVTPAQLGEMIVGGRPPATPARRRHAAATPLVRVLGLQAAHADPRQALGPLSFDIGAGEILGIAGVEGNGQDVLAQALLGLRAAVAEAATIAGRPFMGGNVRATRAAGVAAVAEDRLHDGVAPAMSIADNIIAIDYYKAPLSRRGWLDMNAVRRAAADLVKRCGVSASSVEAPIATLSGGNMQKVVLGREMAAAPRLLIASQPTRGVDIGAARELHRQLLALCTEGAAVLLISADLDELLSLSDRVAVMAGGRIVAHFPAEGLDADALGLYMTAARRHEGATATLEAPFTALPAHRTMS